MIADQTTSQCPHAAASTDRKSQDNSGESPSGEGIHQVGADKVLITGFATARQVLRSKGLRQAGFKAELLERVRGRSRMAVLFQEGPEHQKQRIATARFFAPQTVDTRYRDLMTVLSDALIEKFQQKGEALLDDMSLELAVAVAADIIGLTNSDRAQMTQRLGRFFSLSPENPSRLSVAFRLLKSQVRMLRFYWRDVRPAIRARRSRPSEDVISHLLAQGYTNREILRECLMYGSAGMATTREFIVMAGWHLLERKELQDRFLNTDEAGRIAILEEILRLEPVVGTLYRRAEEAITVDSAEETVSIAAGTLVEIDVRAVNADFAVAGECPHRLDPDRPRSSKIPSVGVSFGDGPHRCPGAYVALQETAIFLDKLLRVPGIRLAKAPTVSWNPTITSYELRNAMLTSVPR